jgi:RNA-directed DNA polymerase
MEVGLLGPIRTIPSAVIAATIAAAARVHARTDRSTLHQGPDELLFWLNGSLQGWANYFRHGLSKDAFNAVGYQPGVGSGTWIRRKHGRISWREVRRRFC